MTDTVPLAFTSQHFNFSSKFIGIAKKSATHENIFFTVLTFFRYIYCTVIYIS